MKKNIYFLAGTIFFLCITLRVSAQDNDRHPITTSGSWALLGTVNGAGPFALTGPSGNGANDPKIIEGIGLRYYLADKWALRPLASFGTNSVNDSTHSTLWGVGIGIEYHAHQLYSTDIYLSGGAGYKSVTTKNMFLGTALSFKQQQGKQGPLDEGNTGTSGDWNANAFALTVAAGFDWYPWNGIALGAEYSLGFVTSSVTFTTNGKEQDVHSFFPAQTSVGFSGGTNIHLVVSL
jgi:hypothetical protein